jgi:hypothetical protein
MVELTLVSLVPMVDLVEVDRVSTADKRFHQRLEHQFKHLMVVQLAMEILVA